MRRKRKSTRTNGKHRNQFAGNISFIAFICLIMILSICMSFSVSRVSAQENIHAETEKTHDMSVPKYYKSIQIQRGDTLWEIAHDTIPSKYHSVPEYIEVLKEINGLESDEIQAGRMLIVEYDK